MTPDFGAFLRLFGETMRDPAATGRQISMLRWPHQIGWMGLGAITALTVIAVHLVVMTSGTTEATAALGSRPFADTVLLGALNVLFIFVLYYAGRAMGGAGSFGGTLLVMTWFQAVVLTLVVIQLIAALIAAPMAGLVALIAMGLQIWCLMHFLNELHGFENLFKALGLFAFSVFGLAVGLSFILLLVGGAAMVGVSG